MTFNGKGLQRSEVFSRPKLRSLMDHLAGNVNSPAIR